MIFLDELNEEFESGEYIEKAKLSGLAKARKVLIDNISLNSNFLISPEHNPKPLRPLFKPVDDNFGNIFLSYGNIILRGWADGRDCYRRVNKNRAPVVFAKLAKAVEAGELDNALNAAITQLKAKHAARHKGGV